MIYYRCDLCGKEQELSKVQQTVHDPCAHGVKLPKEVASRVEGIKDICLRCYEMVMAASTSIYEQAKIDAEQAMFDVTIKLWAPDPGLPTEKTDERSSVTGPESIPGQIVDYLLVHESDIYHQINDFHNLRESFEHWIGREPKA